MTQTRRVWNCQDGLPPQTDPQSTTPGLIGIYGSPMECLGDEQRTGGRVDHPKQPDSHLGTK